VTEKFKNRLRALGKESDIVIAEIGGTVGDIESSSFFEAVRQFKQELPNDVLVVMVAPIIWNEAVSEFKTKPLQNSMKTLQSFGLQADVILCRTDRELPSSILDKISLMTNVPREGVFDAPTVKPIYRVPIEFWNRNIDDLIADKFRLKRKRVPHHKYKELVERYVGSNGNLPVTRVGIVGKYENCDEAYVSLKEACVHAAIANDARIEIVWVSAEDIEKRDAKLNSDTENGHNLDGIIIPGGFDKRGVEGKIKAIRFCRENKIPFLGICLGLQCAVIEFARNVLKIDGATSEEFDKDAKDKVIHYVEGQQNIRKKSATMRLGPYDCELEKDSLVRSLYSKKIISERHRHRYEVNDAYVAQYEEKGFKVSGRNPESRLVEMMELDTKAHPFFVGTQAHPEFKSRLGNPAPLFNGFIRATLGRKAAEPKESGY
jgi:CTP synthase